MTMQGVTLRFGRAAAITLISALSLIASASAQERPKIEIVPNVAHSGAVMSVTFSPDGARIAVAGADKAIALWDATSGQLIRSFRGHTDDINAVAFSPDGARLVSASKDETLKLWDVASGHLLRTFEGHTDEVNSVAFSPDGNRLVSGSDDTTLKLWDAATGQLLRTFEGHSDEVNSVAFSPDGTRLLSGSEDDTVKLWDATTGRAVSTFEGHSESVHAVAFSPDGTRVLSGSDDKTIKLWDAATARLLQTFEGHTEGVYSVAFSPDGARVVSGSEDMTMRLWDVGSGRLVRTDTAHTNAVESVAFSPDGTRLVSGGADGRAIVSAAATGTVRVSLFATPDNEWLAITPSGFFAASAKGADVLGVVRDQAPYSLMQFYDQLCRPDMVEESLKGDPDGTLKDAAAKVSLETIIASGPAPQIELAEKTADGASDSVKLTVSIKDAGGGIGGKIVWRVNGKTEGDLTMPGLQGRPDPGRTVIMTQSLKVDPAQPNTIEITAYNGADLMASLPLKVVVETFGAASQDRPRLAVLTIAVDKYAMSEDELLFAVKDAKDFGDALRSAGKSLYSDVKVVPLFDAEVTKAGIEAAIGKLSADMRPRDAFVLYVAGHGRAVGGRYFFLPQALDLSKGQSIEDGIGQDLWQAWLAKIPAQQTLMILDTCDSAPSAGLLAALTQRGAERQAAMDQLQYATGQNLIAAVRQAAYESYHDHGVLMSAILDALQKPQTAGSPERIDVDYIARTIGERVPEITKGLYGSAQVPFRKLTGSNFALGLRVVDSGPAPQKSGTKPRAIPGRVDAGPQDNAQADARSPL